METSELLKRVRKIEIKTKGLSSHIFSGEYHSAFKGRGMSFSEVRSYQYGDDIRHIDWNVTARTGEPHVKVFEEERELTVMLLVDMSRSAYFGTKNQFKSSLAIEISALLAFSAINNNDKVGLLLFTDRVELFIPPKKGRSHILRIIRELIDFNPSESGTNIAAALEYFQQVIKKRSICFLISDFLADDYADSLRIVGRKHDLVGIRVLDPRETELPNVGLLRVQASESGQLNLLDTSSKRVREAYSDWYKQRDERYLSLFRKTGNDQVTIRTDQSYVSQLLQFFQKRSS